MNVQKIQGANSPLPVNTTSKNNKFQGFAQIYQRALADNSAAASSASTTSSSVGASTLGPSDPGYFSIPSTSAPGSKAPGLDEALNSLINASSSPLTHTEKTQLTFFSFIAEADAESASPRFTSQFPGFSGVGTSSFNADNALRSVIDFLGKSDPNILAAGQQWEAAQQADGSTSTTKAAPSAA